MIVAITAADGAILESRWLARAEAVHRQLRPHLPNDYVVTMRRVFAGGGRMCVATEEERVVGVAVYRMYENTFDGLRLYVDDLVTDESRRSRGVGHALMSHLEALAHEVGAHNLVLDSGTERQQAHKFYFREGMVITSFNFKKRL